VTTDLSVSVPLFVENYRAGKKRLSGRGDTCRRAVAFLRAVDGAVVDPEQVRNLAAPVRTRSWRFAAGLDLVIAAAALGSPDPSGAVRDTKLAWEALKVRPFSPGPFLSATALVLAGRAAPGEFGLLAERARAAYLLQRADHVIVTSADDYVPSLLLALGPQEVTAATRLVETVYGTLKPRFRRNAGQTLAQLLVIGGLWEVELDHVVAVRDALARAKVKLSGQPGASGLGLLVLAQCDHGWLASTVAAVSADLRGAKVVRDTMAMFLVAAALGHDVPLVRAAFLNVVARIVVDEQAAAATAAM